jgi:hypothetical protein
MTVAAIPERTEDQRVAALRKGNAIRSRRALLKAELAKKTLFPAEVLASDADWLETMRVRDVLLATPKVGRVRTDTAMRRCTVTPGRTIGGLTRRQYRDLIRFGQKHWPTVEMGQVPR